MKLDDKYKQLQEICEKYIESETRLRYQIYGYYQPLSKIVPYREHLFGCSDQGSNAKLETFIKQLIHYCKNFTIETGNCFEENWTPEDSKKAEAMIFCIFSYLKEECNRDDYTFYGIIKLLKTFINDCSEEHRYNEKNCIFWILYSDIEHKVRDSYHINIVKSYSYLFKEYDHYALKRIADALYYSVRFYLFEEKLDYTSDHIMMEITEDMLSEISVRLENIHINRKPHRGRRG